ncbi:MAG: 3-keto-disaccharide hydrolase [Flavobacteriaceae bacterium]
MTTGIAQQINPLEGHWNITMDFEGREIPSWLEIKHSGHKTLIGRFVFAFGSARPVAEVKYNGNQFSFALPPQWEPGDRDMEFKGELIGDKLKGSMTYTDGKTHNWVAEKAPQLPHIKIPKWGEPVALFNGKDLNGWKIDGQKPWMVKNGILTCPGSVSNLISEQKFNNFRLHAEFRIPKGSNSGIYLRGRYELQITDSKGMEPSNIQFGGIYGFLTPNEMAAKPAGEWQSYDVILIGRRVTVIANGTPIIMDQIIPGMTGGAIDNKEAEPGSFLLQGDHGAVEFRAFEVTPVIN